MTIRYAFDAVDRTFRDLMENYTCSDAPVKPFGGKTVVLGGDFRQILPVVRRGHREYIVAASLHKSSLWDSCELHILHHNMRLQSAVANPTLYHEMETFSKWVLDIGNGDIHGISFDGPSDSTWIKIPPFMLIPEALGIHGLIGATYPMLESSYSNPEYLRTRAILAPTNKDVDDINELITTMLPGHPRVYFSSDTKVDPDQNTLSEGVAYTPEFLNSLTSSSLPNHRLTLKLGTPIILLRNINQSIGLCNGARLIVSRLTSRVIEASLLTGPEQGRTVAIPRIKLFSDKGQYHFILRRVQFPIRVAFAMTINKSQGQTLDKIGLYLRSPVFCHGQLYVAVSRATSPRSLVFLVHQHPGIPYGYTQNIVYREVLQDVMAKAIISDFLALWPQSTSLMQVHPVLSVHAFQAYPPASPPPGHSHRKCRKKLLHEDDDNTPIANLIRKASASLPPKTPSKHETASSEVAKETCLLLPEETPVQALPDNQPKKHKHRSKRQPLRPESFLPSAPKVQAPQPAPPDLQFTNFADMSHENTKYNMQATVIHFCSVTLSPSETSLSGFLVIKDLQGSLMQVFIPEFLLTSSKDKFVRGLSFEIRDATLFKSTRRTKLVDSLFELHFTEKTTILQVEALPIDLGPLFAFEDLSKIPNFLPAGDITAAQLSVKDIISVVVDLPPLQKRTRRGRVIKFIEAYITDPTIWPSCCLLTIWEDTALKYGQQFLHGFNRPFVLIAQHVRPNCYKGKFGYQTNSFTQLTYSPKGVPTADDLLARIESLAKNEPSTFPHPHKTTWFRKDPLTLHTISILKAETTSCPLPGQDKQFSIPAVVLRVWNDTALTYRCCPLCWTAIHEGSSFPTGCQKLNCPNKEGRSIHRYRVKIIVADDTGRATLTLFEQAAEELFNASSDEVNHYKTEDPGHTRIPAILHEVIDKKYLFHIRVTSANYKYISTMYSSGYTTESAEWVPRLYKPQPDHATHPLQDMPGPSLSQSSVKGRQLAQPASSSSGTNSSKSTSATSSS